MGKAENTYLEKFNEWLMIKGHPTTSAKGFMGTAARYLAWLGTQNIEPENVSYNDILAYTDHCKGKGNGQSTLRLTVDVLKHFYNCLQEGGEVTVNPASNVSIKGIKRKTLFEVFTPEELETIYRSYETEITHEPNKIIPPQKNNLLARKRNKIILGLVIYQGIRTEELAKLELQDLQLREGIISIQGGRRTEGRTMKLEGHQLYDLMDYVHGTRKEILVATGKQSNKVFTSVGSSQGFGNIVQKLVKSVREKHPKVRDIKHLRTSVITNWLKTHNLRKVQYMAGHRYVSSTEAYQMGNIEELQEDIRKYHPIA